MNQSSDKSLEVRVRDVVARALNLSAAGQDDLRMGSTLGWDSAGHMMVVMELEKEFGVSFPAYRLPDLTDLPSIVGALHDAGVS